METKLNSKDICSIIKACADARVSFIKFEGFEINFSETKGEGSPLATEGTHATPKEIEQPLGTAKLDQLSKQAYQDLQDAQLLIDNPADYEAEIASRFLEDVSYDEVRD